MYTSAAVYTNDSTLLHHDCYIYINSTKGPWIKPRDSADSGDNGNNLVSPQGCEELTLKHAREFDEVRYCTRARSCYGVGMKALCTCRTVFYWGCTCTPSGNEGEGPHATVYLCGRLPVLVGHLHSWSGRYQARPWSCGLMS